MEWELLIENLTAGKVVPVLGSDLSSVMENNGDRVQLNNYIARELAKDMGFPYNGESLAELTLVHRREYPEIIPTINSIYRKIDENRFDLEPLKKLAGISDFDFFISTALDDLLLRALTSTRGIEEDRVEVINYSPQELSAAPTPKEKETCATIFNVMGNFFNVLSPAINEEEMLEHFFSLSMNSKPNSMPKYFMERIENKILLFIGCDFPDWFMRFIIRIISNERFQNRTLCDYIVWDGSNGREKLYRFLKQFKENIYPPGEERNGNLRIFIDKLHDCWETDKKMLPLYQGQVFLSYHKKDVNVARMLKGALRKNGIDVWFNGDITAGGNRREINDKIRKCKVFIPLLSSRLLSDPACDARTVEWKSLRERIMADNYYYDGKRLTFKFLPAAVDDIENDDERIPGFFPEEPVRRFPGEQETIISIIREYLTGENKPGEKRYE